MQMTYPEREITERIYNLFVELEQEFGLKVKKERIPNLECGRCKRTFDPKSVQCIECPFFDDKMTLHLDGHDYYIIIEDAIWKGTNQ